MPPLDLSRPRDLGDLLSTTFALWWRHLGVFIGLAAVACFPAAFLVEGLAVGQLADPDATYSTAESLVSNAVWYAIVTPLVTAMHVLVVAGLGRGEPPAFADALRRGVGVLPHAAAVVVLYTITVGCGLVLLIVPGVYIAVVWYFGVQIAVLDGERGAGALHDSRVLVGGQWWRTFGTLIVLQLIAAAVAVPFGYVTQFVGSAADNGPLFVLGLALAQTITLSFAALAGTLLFFDLRARTD